MRSTVIDLPEALEHGRRLALEGGYADVVGHSAGDLLTHPFEECDAVLLSNVLHHLGSSSIRCILGRLRRVLRPHGTVAIWELEAPRGKSATAHSVLAALFFRLTSTADIYQGSEYASWLAAAGFSRIRVLRPRRSSGRVLVLART